MSSELKEYMEYVVRDAWDDVSCIDKDNYEEAYLEECNRAAKMQRMLDYLEKLEENYAERYC